MSHKREVMIYAKSIDGALLSGFEAMSREECRRKQPDQEIDRAGLAGSASPWYGGAGGSKDLRAGLQYR
jgi:hypothetical protein